MNKKKKEKEKTAQHRRHVGANGTSMRRNRSVEATGVAAIYRGRIFRGPAVAEPAAALGSAGITCR